MRVSNDREGSDPTNLGSLGVVDLDLSLSPDVFGQRAFDDKLPLTRMLPGSNPCELRQLLPDSKIGTCGFHDVVIENLSSSPTWRSSQPMSQLCIGDGRGPFSGQCRSVRRKWSIYVVSLVIDQSGHSATACQYIARFLHRGCLRVRYRQSAFRGARLHGGCPVLGGFRLPVTSRCWTVSLHLYILRTSSSVSRAYNCY